MLDSLMAIVPVKPFAESKTRLSGVLNENERSALMARLLKRTLLKLTRSQGISRVAVISRDAAVLKIARSYAAWSITESHSELNEALAQAARICIANGARALLIVPADLPRLRLHDIERIIALGEPAPRVVIAPAQRDGGTNALLLNPANAIAFQFGENSFARHQSAAELKGLPTALYESDTVSFDLDVPEDLSQRM